MSNIERSLLYRALKTIYAERGIPFNVRFGTHQYLVDEYDRINNPFNPVLEQIRLGRQLRPTYPFYNMEGDMRGRVYYINNTNVSMYDTDDLKHLISPRLKHALRTGITNGGDVNIKFNFFDNNIHTSKVFNSFLIRNEQDFWDMIQQYNDINTANTPDYTHTAVGIKITIFAENAGGCSKDKSKKHIGDTIITSSKSSNNNCFFMEVFDLLNLNVKRLGRVKGNTIRREVGLDPDALIPISSALEIYKKYRTNPNEDIRITDNATFQKFQTGDNIVRELRLDKEHYETVNVKVKQQCHKCGTTYINTHKCNLQKQQFYESKVKKTGKRFLLCKDLEESYNNEDEVLHFDLETFQNANIADGFKIHTPYITGYNDGNEFKYFAGDDNIINFVDYILEKGASIMGANLERNKDELIKLNNKLKEKDLTKDIIKKTKSKISKLSKPPTLYVNAYNGANFDHYCIFQEFLRRGCRPEKHIINNGSVIQFSYKNIKLFDMCKHLQGSLSANLKALECNIQKGDFNHDNGSRWEDMSESLREDCLKYLEADVMGMRELYNKLNKTIYNEYKVNLSSFISTSSLTFNMWKKNIRNKFNVQLPNLKQENAFRQSVRGGRTYKSKHQFLSKQYESFHKGECDFEDIDDFVIDADVVSLYPTAMAHYPYPVGECKELKIGEVEMKGKMGIYFIKYETNKHLIHSVGGRRENNALKWDLKDLEIGGWYTSIDIEDMIANGYKVEIIKGFYWEEVEFIFKDYIEKLFKKKEAEAKAGRKGSAIYMLAKLWMNGLYGKNIQRPIYTDSTVIKNNVEYWKFWGKNVITDTTEVENEDGEMVWFITGTPRVDRKREECITKPTQLGAFILAYSRRIMLNYMKEANPHFDISTNPSDENQAKQIENDIYYTDTDSLQMHARNAHMIKDLGKKSLGGITDDLGDNCKIIKGLWIAPKLYMLEYIKKGDPKPHYHFRGKGLNKDSLNVQQFENMSNGGSLVNTREFQMKRIHIKKNSNQQLVPEFSILHYSKGTDASRLTRTVNTTPWAGRDFKDNSSIPWE